LLFKRKTDATAMAWRRRSARLRQLAEGLVKVGALQFGTFSLPDGRDTPYYVNLGGLPSYPGVYGLAVDEMTRLMAKAKADAICTTPVAGLVFAAPASISLKKPLIYTRLQRRGDGRLVEGEVRPGWKFVVVGDLATTGKTILAAAEAVRDEGGEVSSAVVLIDRLEGAREKLSREGVTLLAVTDMMELSDTLHSMELITEDNLKAITKSVGRGP
jgi:orotate phosphoribosyltransferase